MCMYGWVPCCLSETITALFVNQLYKINKKVTKIITFVHPVGGQLFMDILSHCSFHYESTPLKQHKTQIQLALVC